MSDVRLLRRTPKSRVYTIKIVAICSIGAFPIEILETNTIKARPAQESHPTTTPVFITKFAAIVLGFLRTYPTSGRLTRS
jgi:hypothetical protein